MGRFGPIWPENPNCSKSSAENICRRKCAETFMFAPNVHVIEVHTYAFLRLFDEIFRVLWSKFGFWANLGKPGHDYE